MYANLKRLFDYSVPLIAAATILAVAAIAVAVYAGTTAYRIKVASDIVTVTGSAKTAVPADTARWTLRLETKTSVYDQQSGYERLAAAGEKIAGYLDKQGFTDHEAGSIDSYPEYRYEQNKDPVQIGYTVGRSLTVRSNDLDAIAALAENIAALSGSGYTVSSGQLEYTVSSLPELRVSLLSEAIKDARDRATAIAKDSGRAIGELRSASSGVVQVLPEGGVDISDYGTYDTMSRRKEVMVTVRAEFSLQ